MAAVFGSFKVVVTDTSGAVLSLCDKFLGSDEQVQYFRGVKICRSINATPDSRFRINLSIGKGFVFEGCDVLFIGVFMDGIFPQCFIVDKAVFAAQNDVWTASCENRFSSVGQNASDTPQQPSKAESAKCELNIAFWKYKKDLSDLGPIPASNLPTIPSNTSSWKSKHLIITSRAPNPVREWHLQRVNARPVVTFAYVCRFQSNELDPNAPPEEVQEPAGHAQVDNCRAYRHDAQSLGVERNPSQALSREASPDNQDSDNASARTPPGSENTKIRNAPESEDVLQARSRRVYRCSICKEWRTLNNRLSHYQRTHGLISAPTRLEPTRTLDEEEIAKARKTPAFKCLVCGTWRARRNRERHYRAHLMPVPPHQLEQRTDAISLLPERDTGLSNDQFVSNPHFDIDPAPENQAIEINGSELNVSVDADNQFPSGRNAGPAQVGLEPGTPTIKEEPQSPGLHQFTHGLGGAAVKMEDKHDLEQHDDRQDQSTEQQKQDDIFRAFDNLKRCLSPMRMGDVKEVLVKKHERLGAMSRVKRKISAYFRDREPKRSRQNDQLFVEVSDDD